MGKGIMNPTAALYQHCVVVWEEMDRLATAVKDADHKEVEVFTTKLFVKLGLSTPYYSKVMVALKNMDCVRQIKRGGGGAPSQWAILQRPTEELFNEHVQNPTTSSAPVSGTKALQQQVKDLNERVTRLEQAVYPG